MQGNNNISSLFDYSGNLTMEALERYQEGKLTPEELAVVEKHLDGSPFEREALEGLKKFRSLQIARDIKDLNEKLGEKATFIGTKRDRDSRRFGRYYWVAAASVIGILAISVIIVFMFRDTPLTLDLAQVTQDTLIKAQKETTARTAEPAEEMTENDASPAALSNPPAPKKTAEEEEAISPGIVRETKDEAIQKISIVEAEEVVDDDLVVNPRTVSKPSVFGGVSKEGDMMAVGAAGNQNKKRASYTVKAQDIEMMEDTETEAEAEEMGKEIFSVVESMPQFPGGDEAFLKYLTENLHYPDSAKLNGIQGRVFVTFVVETDGSISDVKVLRGIGGGCDEEAVRVVKEMPKWEPGIQRGKAVRVQYNLPIKFSLD